MSSFKEIGVYQPPTRKISPDLKNGGIPLDGNGSHPKYSVRHPNFRLRPIDENETRHFLSEGDIDPIRLTPKNITKSLVPDSSEEVKKGIEAEYLVINQEGKLVDLYGGDEVHNPIPFVRGPEVEHTGKKWLIDEIELNPEALRWQGEIATKPALTWDQIEIEILKQLVPVVRALDQRGLLLLPSGMSGHAIGKKWNNIAPHPYILSVHDNCLDGTAIDLDACAIQTHTDLALFGSGIEFGLHGGNIINDTFATMLHALATGSPFNRGRVTDLQATREMARRRLSTKGGITLYNYPLDGDQFLREGNRAIRSGKIPVPERAAGSHNDTRSAKLTTGTIEVGPADMNGNTDFAIAQAVLTTHLMVKIAKSIRFREPIPSFLTGNGPAKRERNRNKTSKYGYRTEISVQNGRRGKMTITQAWKHFLDWISPDDIYNRGYKKAEDTIRRMLVDPTPSAAYGRRSFEKYFERGGGCYLQGNPADVMRAYANSVPGTDEKKIRATNVAYAQEYMGDIRARMKERGIS